MSDEQDEPIDYTSYEYRHLLSDDERIDELVGLLERGGQMVLNHDTEKMLTWYLKLWDRDQKPDVSQLSYFINKAVSQERLVMSTRGSKISITVPQYAEFFTNFRTKKEKH